MNRFDREVKLFSRFPKYGWIFPCSQCDQPVFKEYYSRFICKQCKIKNCTGWSLPKKKCSKLRSKWPYGQNGGIRLKWPYRLYGLKSREYYFAQDSITFYPAWIVFFQWAKAMGGGMVVGFGTVVGPQPWPTEIEIRKASKYFCLKMF